MSLTNRLLFATVLALLGGVLFQGWLLAGQYRSRQAAADQVATAQKQLHDLRQEKIRADAQRIALEKEIAAMIDEVATTGPAANDTGLLAWLRRVDRLQEWLQKNPGKQIPEMQFLNSNDWLSATFDNRMETEAQIRLALKKLRTLAKAKAEISQNLSQAIGAYARDHGGTPISDVAQLKAYLQPPLGDNILTRYEIVPEIPGENDRNGVNRDGTKIRGAGRIVLQESVPADPDYDTRLIFMEQGASTTIVGRLGKAVSEATTAFIKANPGQRLSQPGQLLPYLTPPVDEQALREYWEVKDWK